MCHFYIYNIQYLVMYNLLCGHNNRIEYKILSSDIVIQVNFEYHQNFHLLTTTKKPTDITTIIKALKIIRT